MKLQFSASHFRTPLGVQVGTLILVTLGLLALAYARMLSGSGPMGIVLGMFVTLGGMFLTARITNRWTLDVLAANREGDKRKIACELDFRAGRLVDKITDWLESHCCNQYGWSGWRIFGLLCVTPFLILIALSAAVALLAYGALGVFWPAVGVGGLFFGGFIYWYLLRERIICQSMLTIEEKPTDFEPVLSEVARGPDDLPFEEPGEVLDDSEDLVFEKPEGSG